MNRIIGVALFAVVILLMTGCSSMDRNCSLVEMTSVINSGPGTFVVRTEKGMQCRPLAE